jgi:3-phytase
MLKALLLCGLAAALAACSTVAPQSTRPAGAAVAGAHAVTVPERYVSVNSPGDEFDSLATWPAPDGHTWLIATAKSSHTLAVFDADSGERLRAVGGLGDAPGRFRRPNGIAVFGDHVFVVERDNHRVQVLSLPDFVPQGSFGADDLRSPYGIWIDETGPDEYEAYVTDNFMEGARFDVVPPLAQLDRRVHRYRVEFDDAGKLSARADGHFGSTDAADALRIVESIAGDPAQQRLLIADEDTRHESTLREYGFDGRPSGRRIAPGAFEEEAEGIALWSCGTDAGYWIAVDQRYPRTRFLVFDRTTLAPRGVFTGEVVAHTDGIALHAAATTQFPFGALFAVHDDKAVAAFDLGDVTRALGLDSACTD